MTALNDVDGAPVAVVPARFLPLSDGWRYQGRNRRIGRLVIASLLVHLLLLLLIIGVTHFRWSPEALPPPAVSMLWESGKGPPPSRADRPNSLAAPSPPPAAVAEPSPVPTAPVAPPPPTAPPAPAQTFVAPPEVAAPGPPAPVVASPAPAPAPAPAQAARQTLAARPPPTSPAKPSTKPQTHAMLRPRPRPPSPFSSPMNFSYGPTRPRQALPSRDPSRSSDSPLIGPSPAPSGAETIHLEPNSDGKRGPGTDWLNELSDWIESHKFYPDKAVMNGEEGDAEVRVTIDRYGHVKSVELVSRSGSIWLDMAAQALFRDRTLPPLPSDSPLQTVTFDLTTHYILIR